MTTKDIISGIKGVFKLPVKKYYFGKIRHGSPYFYPWNFNSTIIKIRKQRPKFARCRHFKLFGYEIDYGWPITYINYGLGWKDKFESPRFEWTPSFQIYFFGLQFCIWWIAPVDDDDLYWEMVLWYINYCKKDLNKAKKTWGWVDYNTKKSTWNRNNCLL